MKFFSSEYVSERIIRIRDICGVAVYLIIGDDKACLLDTGCGFGDLRSYVERLTDKELIVILTHGHTDHASGVSLFEDRCIYLNAMDKELLKVHTTFAHRDEMAVAAGVLDKLQPADYNSLFQGETLSLEHEQEFDLGGITLEAIHTPGHTQGMTMILIKEEQMILFGDGCGVSVLLLDEYASSVEEYLETLINLKKYQPFYHTILRNHGTCESPKELLDNVIECCQCIMAGGDDHQPASRLPMACEGAFMAKAVTEYNNRVDGKEGNLVYRYDKIWSRNFPESEELPEGAYEISLEDTYGYGVNFKPDVTYINRAGTDLHLNIITPVDKCDPMRTWPLIVFIQGSGWGKQNLYDHFPLLLRMAQRGYVTAIVEYRSSDIAAFPAQVEDAKTAIRYLKKNAQTYSIDCGRIALWGDSSGGHTAVMVAVTENNWPDTDAYGEFTTAVNCVIDWYGPTDISKMSSYPSTMDHVSAQCPEGKLLGGVPVLDNPDRVYPTVPMNYISKEKKLSPILVMHGGSDMLVPFNQSVRLYEKLKETGKEVEFVKLTGAHHGHGGFNSDKALDFVEQFMKKYL